VQLDPLSDEAPRYWYKLISVKKCRVVGAGTTALAAKTQGMGEAKDPAEQMARGAAMLPARWQLWLYQWLGDDLLSVDAGKHRHDVLLERMADGVRALEQVAEHLGLSRQEDKLALTMGDFDSASEDLRKGLRARQDDAFLEGIAEQAGVELWRWAEERESGGWAGEIESDELLWSKEFPRRITPLFMIGPTGGEARSLRHFTFEESKVFDEAIREFL
jgi:hypothetical protein